MESDFYEFETQKNMDKVDIIRKHIGNDDFYDMNGTPLLTKILAAMDEYAQQQVKNCSIPAVVGRSEQLTCPRCKSTNILNPDKDNDAQCIECAFIWAG